MSGGQMSCPIVFRGPNGAASRVGAQHSQDFSAWYGHVPGLKVVAPYDAADAKGLLKAAIRDDNPVVFFNHLALGGQRGEVPDEEYTIPLGKGEIKRAGTDVTICAAGLMVHRALDAAKILEKENISVEVVDLRTLKPWDETLVLESVAKTGRFVAVDESYPICGAASEWAATVAEKGFHDLKAPVQRLSNKHLPMPFSPTLEKQIIPSVEEIVATVRRVLI